eukprot:1139479-Heterocapsa_arctica.AAC.1
MLLAQLVERRTSLPEVHGWKPPSGTEDPRNSLTLPSPPPGAPAPALSGQEIGRWKFQRNSGKTSSWALQEDPLRGRAPSPSTVGEARLARPLC